MKLHEVAGGYMRLPVKRMLKNCHCEPPAIICHCEPPALICHCEPPKAAKQSQRTRLLRRSLRSLLAMTFFLIFSAAKLTYAADWYNPDWQYRKAITIDHTKVSGTQADFPLLVQCSNAAWKDTTNGGKVGQSDGGDILFTSSDGTGKLSHEIERYIPSTGEVIAWVKIPALSDSTDTAIYMYYGNASCDDQWNVNDVWSNGYVGVWHSKDITTSTINDSTSNANNGAKRAAYRPTEANGKVYKAQRYDGSYDYVQIDEPSIFDVSDFTYSVWINARDSSGWDTIIDVDNDEQLLATLNGVYAIYGRCGTHYQGTFKTGSWHHLVWTVSGSSYSIYEDGISIGSGSGCSSSVNADHLMFGSGYGGNEYFSGTIDEVEFSSTARSASWIATEYNNQKSPDTFYSMGRETTVRNATVRNATIR